MTSDRDHHEIVAEGRAPSESSKREGEYLSKKLEEIRKDCQWLLGLAAVSVLRVVLKENFAIATPRLRTITLLLSAMQILICMVGAVFWSPVSVDPAHEVDFLTRRLKAGFFLKIPQSFFLSISFILIAVMGLNPTPTSK